MNIVYIIAESLQLAGALVLFQNFWGGKLQDAVIRTLEREEARIHWETLHENKSSVTYTTDEQQSAAVKVLRNRFAFIYIAVGYAAGIIGEQGNKCVDFIAILVTASLLGTICILGSRTIAKNKFKTEKTVVKSEKYSK
ncbi:hypothetical protein SAMN02910358_02608 [Lachnospiraceae bacterium XBB1006]|nr:hypothetical protein SAMN02910358_02608 [Lachnospiraceae bacterium XBB1006]